MSDPTAADDDDLLRRLLEARARLEGVAHHTPVATSRTLDRRLGARVFLKCENLQRAGAFKLRGAHCMISRLPEDQRRRGVVAYSSGNHAQAVALVAREIAFYDQAGEGREAMAERLARARGLVLVPPFDHPDIVSGQGTAALELFEDAGPMDLLLVPVGGGGLISGAALAARALAPGCRVIGVEPDAGDDGVRSFQSGQLTRVESRQTIADGARTPSLGRLTFGVIRRHVADMVSVPDEALVRAMRFVWERMKLVVEPTGVLGLAALLEGRVACAGQRAGVILSGGNVELAAALELFR